MHGREGGFKNRCFFWNPTPNYGREHYGFSEPNTKLRTRTLWIFGIQRQITDANIMDFGIQRQITDANITNTKPPPWKCVQNQHLTRPNIIDMKPPSVGVQHLTRGKDTITRNHCKKRKRQKPAHGIQCRSGQSPPNLHFQQNGTTSLLSPFGGLRSSVTRSIRMEIAHPKVLHTLNIGSSCSDT